MNMKKIIIYIFLITIIINSMSYDVNATTPEIISENYTNYANITNKDEVKNPEILAIENEHKYYEIIDKKIFECVYFSEYFFKTLDPFDFEKMHIVIKSQKEYDELRNFSQIVMPSCKEHELPIIDFDKYDLIIKHLSGGGCTINFYEEITFDENKKELTIKTDVKSKGNCAATQQKTIAMLLKKHPDNKITFIQGYVRNKENSVRNSLFMMLILLSLFSFGFFIKKYKNKNFTKIMLKSTFMLLGFYSIIILIYEILNNLALRYTLSNMNESTDVANFANYILLDIFLISILLGVIFIFFRSLIKRDYKYLFVAGAILPFILGGVVISIQKYFFNFMYVLGFALIALFLILTIYLQIFVLKKSYKEDKNTFNITILFFISSILTTFLIYFSKTNNAYFLSYNLLFLIIYGYLTKINYETNKKTALALFLMPAFTLLLFITLGVMMFTSFI
ncbi:MAG: hypothetical protein ACLFN8_04405 [Candidatus Woesearchaeota archaeon]